MIKKVRKCIEPTCGVHFMGGPLSKYCDESKRERKIYTKDQYGKRNSLRRD